MYCIRELTFVFYRSSKLFILTHYKVFNCLINIIIFTHLKSIVYFLSNT